MTMKKAIIASVAVLAATGAAAQTMPLGEQRQFRLAAFRTIQNYEHWLQWVNDANDETYFDNATDLFLSPEVPVFNDLLGLSNESSIPASQYIGLLADNATTNSIAMEVKNVQMRSISRGASGQWVMDVAFSKSIAYTTPCGIHFDSNRHYSGNDYDIVATMMWNPADSTCRITRVTGSVNSVQPHYGTDFVVLRNSSERDSRLRINGEAPAFDDLGYSMYANYAQLASFKYPDPDMRVRVKPVPGSESCNIYQASYRRKLLRLRPWMIYGVGNYYSLKTSSDFNIDDSKSRGTEFGLDFGISFPSNKATKVGIFFGAGLAQSNLEMSAKGQYDLETTEDIDGDYYKRRYRDIEFSQKVKFTDLIVPLYFEFEFPFSNRVKMLLDLGGRLVLPMGSKTEYFNATYRVDGLYSKYDNLVFGPEAGINGFTELGTLNEDNVVDGEFERESFGVDAFGRLALRVNIWGPINLDLGAQYTYGFMDTYKTDDYYNDYPITYSASSNREEVRTAKFVTGLSHRAIGVFGSLTFKF